jgi:hypothetical protein
MRYVFIVFVLLVLIVSGVIVKQNNLNMLQETVEPVLALENTAAVEITFGYSEKDKPITGYVFGNGADTTLMFGSIHGNEIGSADLMNKLVDYIKSNSNTVSENKRLVIIPILNPDGYYDRTDKLNANDVNLNLNFLTKDWSMYGKDGQYAGPKPWSEAESNVLKTVVEKYLPNRMIAYHAKGYLSVPETGEQSKALANWYAEQSGYIYYDNPEWDYTGTATRWFEETYDKPAITVELDELLSSDWEINKTPMLELMN